MMINDEVFLTQEEKQQTAKVIFRTIDSNGNIIGNFDENPVINQLVYDVEFTDGPVKHHAEYVIAENVFSQVDLSGLYAQALDKIVIHRKLRSSVSTKDDYVTTKRGICKLSHTTIGWEFLIEWKYGFSSWMYLKVLKESNPIEVEEYATNLGLANEPAFLWWVPFTLKKRYHIISLVNIQVRKRNHKFGIQTPNNIKDILDFLCLVWRKELWP